MTWAKAIRGSRAGSIRLAAARALTSFRRSTIIMAALFAVLTLTATAAASQSPSVTITVFDSDGQPVPGILAQDMYPSASVRHTVFVSVNDALAEGRVGTDLINLEDFENGCTRPEIRAGDTTCGTGPDQGELSEQLEVSWTRGTVHADGSCELDDRTLEFAGTRLHDAIGETVDLGHVPDGNVLCFELALEFLVLPENNLAQGDSTRFDLRVGVDGQPAPTPSVDPAVIGRDVIDQPDQGPVSRPDDEAVVLDERHDAETGDEAEAGDSDLPSPSDPSVELDLDEVDATAETGAALGRLPTTGSRVGGLALGTLALLLVGAVLLRYPHRPRDRNQP